MSETTDIAAEIVVFKNPDGSTFSNDPRWHDPAVRKAWEARDAAFDPDEYVEGEEEPEDYNAWTNDELRAELSGRNLSVDGKKADLVSRLEEDDSKAEA